MQGTPLQQSLFMVQTWPYSAQTGLPPSLQASALEPSMGGGGPASPGGGDPQTPRVEPGGRVQGIPGQQSAAVVHVPPLPTHSPPQTKGGAPASWLNVGLGTQVEPQQSALVAHGCPALDPASVQGCPSIVQRGMPRMSCWQAKGF